jgi:hypothetical protein
MLYCCGYNMGRYRGTRGVQIAAILGLGRLFDSIHLFFFAATSPLLPTAGGHGHIAGAMSATLTNTDGDNNDGRSHNSPGHASTVDNFTKDNFDN